LTADRQTRLARLTGIMSAVGPWLAFTRPVSPAIARCELTHLVRQPIDVELARNQHGEYERRLASLGCTVERIEADDEMADSVFIEDTAVAFDELAIVARPGAESRRAETTAVAAALRRVRPVVSIREPAILDGGDVLVAGRRVFVGLSTRTNRAAIEQLSVALAPHRYAVEPIEIGGCLHLKSAVTALADDMLLVNRQWVETGRFRGFGLVDVDPDEPSAANALRIGEVIVFPAEFPRTRTRLEQRGFDVRAVPAGELAKAEGGVTCCSLILGIAY